MVYRRADRKWVNQRNDRQRATSLHNTQRAAQDAARRNLQNQGGGELSVKGLDGKVREKTTVHPGHDPFPPKG